MKAGGVALRILKLLTPSTYTNCHSKGFEAEVFTGRKPFLLPNQQHQSTKGNKHCGQSEVVADSEYPTLFAHLIVLSV